MADVVNVGQSPNDGTGVDNRAAFIAINAAFVATNAATARALSVASSAPTQDVVEGVATEVSQLQSTKADRGRRAVQDQSITALVTDTYLGVTALTAPRTITLPAASAFPQGQALDIADESGLCSSSLTITVVAAGADKIAGQASVSLVAPGQKVSLHSNGANAWTVAGILATTTAAASGIATSGGMTPALTTSQIAASIASGPIGTAFSTKAVPAAAGAVSRTFLDRFGDNVVAHDLSDGSGAFANDDAALTAAFNAAQAAGFNSQGFLRPVLLTRPFNLTTQHPVPAGMRIYSTTQNASLIARAASGSMLNITGGRTRVEGLLFQNPSLLTVTPITVNKPHNDYTVGLKRLDFGNFPIAIDWILGDRPDFEDVYGVSVGLLMRFQADAQNGHIVRPKVFGGNLLSISKASGAQYQMEGTTFAEVNAIQGPATFGGAAPSGPVILITQALALRFPSMMIDQVTTGGAVRIDASASGAAVEDITFSGWAGGATPIGAGVPGVNYRGNVARCHWFGGKINGFSDYGWAISGNSNGTANAHHNGMHGVEFRLNTGGDVGSAYGNDNVLNFCELNSTSVTLYEVVSSQMMGTGNFFVKAPSQVSATSQFYSNRGPGAFRGFPTAATGLNQGNFYYNTSTGAVMIV